MNLEELTYLYIILADALIDYQPPARKIVSELWGPMLTGRMSRSDALIFQIKDMIKTADQNRWLLPRSSKVQTFRSIYM